MIVVAPLLVRPLLVLILLAARLSSNHAFVSATTSMSCPSSSLTNCYPNKGALFKQSNHHETTEENKMSKTSLALKFTLEKGHYRLYAALSCPFAHRVRLVRLLQHGLEDVIDVTLCTAQTASDGFTFGGDVEPIFGALSLKQVYLKANPKYDKPKYTVPLMVDTATQQMVPSNESLELAVALAVCTGPHDLLLPEGAEALAREVDETIVWSPYRYLFSSDPQTKQQVVDAYFAKLTKYEQLLSQQDYLLGPRVTLPDLVFWAALIRYDNVYARQFGMAKDTTTQSLAKDYSALTRYMKRIWDTPNAKRTTTLGQDANMAEIVRMYWQSEVLAPKAGNDPKAPMPPVLDLF